MPRDQLKAALDKATQNNPDERILLRADQSVDYGQLMGVMNELRTAGYLKIGLVGLESATAAAAAAGQQQAAAR